MKAWCHRAGPPVRRRCPPCRAVPPPDRHGHSHRDRAHGQRVRPRRSGQRADQRRPRPCRTARQPADGRHPDGGCQPRRHPAAHPALPGPGWRTASASRRATGRHHPASAPRPGHGPAARVLPRQHHGRYPEDPSRHDPRGQGRHRHRVRPQLPGRPKPRDNRRRATPDHRRDPPIQRLVAHTG